MIITDYTLAPTDNGATLALGGNSLFTLTAPPASCYDPCFACRVVNTDTTRGKTLTIDGSSNFILWPGQVVDLFSAGGAWQRTNPGRWRNSNVTVFVDHANGNDANDGLQPLTCAFKTIQAAVDCVTANVDAGKGANGVTIQLANETFYENVICHGPVPFQIVIRGNSASPGSVNWVTVPGSGVGARALNAHDDCIVVVHGVTFWGGDVSHCAIGASQFGFVGFADVVFQNFSGPGSAHINIGALGCANWEGGGYEIAGSATYHLNVQGPSWFYCFAPAIAVDRPLSFTDFITASGAGAAVLFSGASFTGPGAGGATSGAQFALSGNATLTKGSLVLPGTMPGTVASGAQVL